MARAIYKITNTVNLKFYVGSSVDTRRRFKHHRRRLERGIHTNPHLQSAWNKYGAKSFDFHVVQLIPERDSLQAAEDVWLKEHVGKKYCYNLGYGSDAPWRGRPGCEHPNYGRPLSEDQKSKISAAVKERYKDPSYQPRLGKKHSKASKVKISKKVQQALAEGRGGKFIPSKKTRKRMSESLKGNQCATGYKRSAEEKEAIRKRMVGNTLGAGKRHSDESRAKMGEKLYELTTRKEFAVMNDAVKFYGMANLATILRSIKTGRPLSKGPNAGLLFSRTKTELESPECPTTRKQAIEQGAKHYFTGNPCKRGHVALRLTKGICIECRKEDWGDENAKRKSKPKSEASKAAGRRYYLRNKELVKERTTLRVAAAKVKIQ